MVSWHLDGAKAALAQGRDAVIATDPTLYFDHRQSGLSVEPPGRGDGQTDRTGPDAYEPACRRAASGPRTGGILSAMQANSLERSNMPTEADVAKMAFSARGAWPSSAGPSPKRQDWADFATFARLPAVMWRVMWHWD